MTRSELVKADNIILRYAQAFRRSPSQALTQASQGLRSRYGILRERVVINSFNHFMRRRFSPITQVQSGKILFGTCLAGNPARGHWTGPLEAMLARYLLSERGIEPNFLFLDDDPIRHNVYRGFGFEKRHFHVHKDFAGRELSDNDRALVESLNFNDVNAIYSQSAHGIPLGRLAVSSTRRALAVSRLERASEIRELQSRFEQGLRLVSLGEEVISNFKPDYILTNHSSYIEYGGVIFHLGIRDKIPTSSWQIFDPQRFSVHNFYPDERMDNVFGPSSRSWDRLKLHLEHDKAVAEADAYLQRRFDGQIGFLPRQPKIGTANQSKQPELAKFDNRLPTVAVFTHLPWEVGAFYSNAYLCHRDWLEATATAAINNPNVNWIFRIHPSEAVKGSKESTFELLKELIPADSPNIRIIEPTNPVSSYSLLEHISVAVTIRGTLALELPCLGIPVVCTGAGVHTLGSFAKVSLTPAHYESQLASIHQLKKLEPAEIREAKLVAYAYFINAPIRIHCLKNMIKLGSFLALTQESLRDDAGVQCIADIILSKSQVKDLHSPLNARESE